MNLRDALIETSPTQLSDRCHGSKGEFARRDYETHGIIRGMWLYLVARSLQRSPKLQECPEYLAARRTKNNASHHPGVMRLPVPVKRGTTIARVEQLEAPVSAFSRH
jgi:hypothetical protein